MDSLYNSNNELIIKPKNDVIFKKLFIENEDLLQDLVASIMGVPYDSIKELTILNNEMTAENISSKRCTLDLRLSVNGDPFSIEIHLTDDNYFIDRSVFYWVKLFITPLKSGQDYTLLRKTVSVNIVDYTMFENYDDPHTVIRMKNSNDDSVFYDKFQMHFFELTKLKGGINKSDRCDMWMKFINARNKEDIDMITASNDSAMNKAVFKIREMSDDEKVIEEAFQREMYLHDIASIKKRAADEARAEAEAAVLKAKEEVEKAKVDAEKKAHEKDISNIKRMLDSNKFSHEEIAEYLNVPLELVKETSVNMR